MTSNDIAHQFLLFSHMLADKFITVKNNHIKNIVQNTHDWNTSLTIRTVLLVEREHRRLIKIWTPLSPNVLNQSLYKTYTSHILVHIIYKGTRINAFTHLKQHHQLIWSNFVCLIWVIYDKCQGNISYISNDKTSTCSSNTKLLFLKFQSNYITIAFQFIPLWFLPITSAVYSCIWILSLKTWEMYHFTSKPVDADNL